MHAHRTDSARSLAPRNGERRPQPEKVNTADQKVPRKGRRADMERTIPALPKAPLERSIPAVRPQQPIKKKPRLHSRQSSRDRRQP
jgi:hypothetical protein